MSLEMWDLIDLAGPGRSIRQVNQQAGQTGSGWGVRGYLGWPWLF